ncbi:MAG: hypothetical protein R3268_00060 [Acidiferrobacterales bacterium]|nr:hypothetical protein [Acidiferrobacterales bacterium]
MADVAEMQVDEVTGAPYEVVGEPEAVETQEPEQPAAEEQPTDDISPKEKERRTLQSELDKTRARLEALEAEKSEIDAIRPLYELTTKDPEFRRTVSEYLDGGGKAAPTGAKADKSLPVAPVPPEMPHDYNAEDARLDPASTSAKYERDRRKYEADRVTYLENLILSEREERQSHLQRQQAQAEREQQLDKVALRAGKVYGVAEDRLPEYRSFIGNVTPELEEEVYAFYFNNKGKPGAEEVVNKRREQDLRRQAEASKQSVPAAAGPTGQTEAPDTGPPTQPLKKQVRGSLI